MLSASLTSHSNQETSITIGCHLSYLLLWKTAHGLLRSESVRDEDVFVLQSTAPVSVLRSRQFCIGRSNAYEGQINDDLMVRQPDIEKS